MEVKQKNEVILPSPASATRGSERAAPKKRGEMDLIQTTQTKTVSHGQDDHPARALVPQGFSSAASGDLWEGRSKMQEVIPNLLISNFFGSKNTEELRNNKITHVVVCANELLEVFPNKFSYMKLSGLTDNTGTRLEEYFEKALPWIKSAIEGGGRVLLHCASGSSRSGAILTAYLMWDQNLSTNEALTKAKSARPIIEPNPGFIEQLKAFETSKEKVIGTKKQATKDSHSNRSPRRLFKTLPS